MSTLLHVNEIKKGIKKFIAFVNRISLFKVFRFAVEIILHSIYFYKTKADMLVTLSEGIKKLLVSFEAIIQGPLRCDMQKILKLKIRKQSIFSVDSKLFTLKFIYVTVFG